MINAVHENPFVRELIELQQDGAQSICGPATWLVPPLLEVSTTDEDEQLQQLVRAVVPREHGEGRGRWHWLIGSPGNGKSAKLGRLFRELRAAGYRITCEGGAPISEADSTQVPYLLEVWDPDKEYPFAYLVQDASVVRSPFQEDCNPADDLMRALDSACDRGASLIVCTNWGVLHRLFDLVHTNPEVRDEKHWWPAVRGLEGLRDDGLLVKASGKKPVFREMDLTYETLDHRSMLVNSDLFERLVLRATEATKWEACSGCPSFRFCPFKANRDDLASKPFRKNVLDLLRRAEVIDGQVVVFREAVALVSLLLAGCPGDYRMGGPCHWVHDRLSNGDVFHLLARRASMLLFGSRRPCGLELALTPRRMSPPRREQQAALKGVAKLFVDSSATARALEAAVDPSAVSVDVGIKRLLGQQGAIPRLAPALDPCRSSDLETFFDEVEEWGANALADGSNTPAATTTQGLSPIEHRCIRLWGEMVQAVETAEATGQEGDPYYWLRRWQTTCMGWWAATSRGLTKFQHELDEYVGVFEASGTQAERAVAIDRTEQNIEGLLAPAGEQHARNGVELASSMSLLGQWADSKLLPKIEDTTTSSSKLSVRMGAGHEFVVAAETFATLRRRHDLGLSDVSFKGEVLEALKSTRAQAAAVGDYAVENNGVTLVVVDHRGQEYILRRVHGHLVPPDGDP